MLERRGFGAAETARDIPVPPGAAAETLEALASRLGHYGFRLFLRGAIQRPAGFRPAEATRYLDARQARAMAEELVAIGLATQPGRGRYRLLQPARSFGGTLEWYVARELRRQFGLDAIAGVKFAARGIGGDLDVVAAAEGRLIYLELKSSPPRHLTEEEVAAFFDRLRALRPDVGMFVIDTALRLPDKVLPMLAAELARRGGTGPARRLVREVWALTPHVFALNARGGLVRNIGLALAEGLRALAPEAP